MAKSKASATNKASASSRASATSKAPGTKKASAAKKTSAARKKGAARVSRSLGSNPFEKNTAKPMSLLSLDPSAKPPGRTGASQAPSGSQASSSASSSAPSTRATSSRRKASPAKPAAGKKAAAGAPAKTASPKAEVRFESMQTDFAERLSAEPAPAKSASRGTPFSDEQIERIDSLLQRLQGLEMPEKQRGLFDRVAKAWHFFSMFGRSMTVDDFGLDPRFEELVDPIFSFLYHKWWRVDATGLENIPADGRALIVANHSGMLPYDGGMIKYAVRDLHPAHREVRPLVEDFVYHFPFLGALMARIGGVRACQENARRLLEQDELVVVFPEGVKGIAKLYRYRYQLQRFGRGGFVRLCLRTGAPIIPTAVVGAEEIHPIVARADWLGRPLKLPVVPITPTLPFLGPLGMIPFPTKWFIHFGRPIDLRNYGKAALDDDMLINRITADVRTQIQESIYEQLKSRRSVFFG